MGQWDQSVTCHPTIYHVKYGNALCDVMHIALVECPCCHHKLVSLPDRAASRLRESAVGLLLVEADAVKWYKEHSIPYFEHLGDKLDRSAAWTNDTDTATPAQSANGDSSSIVNSDNGNGSSGSGGGSHGSAPCQCRECSCHLDLQAGAMLPHTIDSFVALLDKEIATLQSVLLSFPSKPGGAPDAFLALETDGRWAQVLELDLDRDGLEIVLC